MGKTRTAVDQIFDATAAGQMGRQGRTGDHVFTNTVCGSDTLDDVIPHMHALFVSYDKRPQRQTRPHGTWSATQIPLP